MEGSLLSSLNEQQRAVVAAPRQNMLVVAGAGTGKTRVLVSRVAWLLGVEAVPARALLAVTFTNKAAEEMRERIHAMNFNSVDLRGLWIGTFHSICARFLRAYAAQTGLQSNFTVLDTTDQTGIVEAILKEDPDLTGFAKLYKITPARIASQISKFKEQGRRASDLGAAKRDGDALLYCASCIYPEYEKRCNAANGVDFSELLLRTWELFANNQPLRELQHHRFAEILVDEFQDTNPLQYRLLRLLCGPQCHIFAVGDDDQSIYGWRGADVANMANFQHDCAPVQLFKLERNYRSTSQIIQAANTLIRGNSSRLTDKNLVSDHGSGEKIRILTAYNNTVEACAIASTIASLTAGGVKPGDIAVLYRVNSRALAIEQALMSQGIPYYVYGGLRFYDRREIHDAISYLKLAVNHSDDASFSRIINVPPRGIGPTKLETLEQIAAERQCSRLQALRLAVEYAESQGKKAGRAISALAKSAAPFLKLMDEAADKIREGTGPAALLSLLLENSGLLNYYRELDIKEAAKTLKEGKREFNLQELISNAAQTEYRQQVNPDLDAEGRPIDPVIAFLSNAALMSSTELDANGEYVPPSEQVRLFTIHSAKGLEFDTVFVSGFEDGVMPWGIGWGGSDFYQEREEEERRLAYVAITRARRCLYLCYAMHSPRWGGDETGGPSDYLRELRLGMSRRQYEEAFAPRDYWDFDQ